VPPTFNIEAAFAQLMSSMESLQQEVNLIGERVVQSQIDIRKKKLHIVSGLKSNKEDNIMQVSTAMIASHFSTKYSYKKYFFFAKRGRSQSCDVLKHSIMRAMDGHKLKK